MTIFKMNPKYLEELLQCEMGAHEDEIYGPSPLTTVTILKRSKKEIQLETLEEAVQVYDCTRYGTFPHHCPRAAERTWASGSRRPSASP